MANSEAGFSAQLRYEIKEFYGDKVFVYLLPNMRMTGKKPYDFQVIYRSKFFAFECKYLEGDTLNVQNHIRPHQPECLREVIKAGGFGYFIVCFKKYDMALLISPNMLDYLTEKYCSDSLKYKNIKENVGMYWWIERKKFEKKRWDVERILHD